ncbi:MAG TPA: GNAT family N-acetyltransferase, partial [Phycisphaerae bacterium]|nr:GNAT family N-acetyltransferase [Phycisphaerae bacterium]
YPSHWFEPRMLDTKQYFGIRGADGLVSVAGVHVYSEKYKVAALGNIATHPAHRRTGCATAAIAHLCRNLLKTVEHVGLNVKADNRPAIACYQKLGFEIVGAYEEYSVDPL